MSDYQIYDKPDEHVDDTEELTTHREYVVSEIEARMMIEEMGLSLIHI